MTVKKSKPFLSENNPLDVSIDDCENFKLEYLYPRYWFTWLGIFFSYILNILPQTIRLNLGKIFGFIIYIFNIKRKNIAKKNLDICFQSFDSEKKSKILKKYFLNLGRTYADLPTLWWRSNNKVQSMIEVRGIENIENELANGKGVIVLTAHSVSLDFGGRSLSKFPIISMYKPFRNKLINWFIGKSRSKSTDNAIVFPRDNFPFKNLVTALKHPNIFYYVGDEDLGLDNSEFADFFDGYKSTLVAIRKICKISKCSIIPVINLFDNSSKKYVTYIEKPISNFPSKSSSSDARVINSAFESLININKSEYMWSMRIFQTSKKEDRYPYGKY